MARYSGPFDAGDYGAPGELLDAGALWLPALPGLTLNFGLDNASHAVLAAIYTGADFALQLQAYAAPKSRGIWDKVRLDMGTAIAQAQGTSTAKEGPFGWELHVLMPLPDADGGEAGSSQRAANGKFAAQRIVGIDGPRWLLKATITGAAAQDEALAQQCYAVIDRVVVNRGGEPHVPRELLPLKLPAGVLQTH